MQLTTQSKADSSELGSFIDEVCGESRLRVESDLGDGFVRLRISEAEKRQAAQDIRSTEDVVIEMLRNARDAHAKIIFLALQREGTKRVVTILDDGDGIPENLHSLVFEPRVTSKLDTAHMDKWGMHGRGMALYSIKVNARRAEVRASKPGLGSSIQVETSLETLPEKTDQSTFPVFELQESGSYAMRGPKNVLRTAAEFAMEHRKICSVYCGTPAEICATLYAYGMAATTPTYRAFTTDFEGEPLVKRLALSADPAQFAALAASMGLEISERTARRIMDGSLAPLSSLMDRLQNESFAKVSRPNSKGKTKRRAGSSLKLTDEDAAHLAQKAAEAYAQIAEGYYLDPRCEPQVSVSSDAIKITIPIVEGC